LEKIL